MIEVVIILGTFVNAYVLTNKQIQDNSKAVIIVVTILLVILALLFG